MAEDVKDLWRRHTPGSAVSKENRIAVSASFTADPLTPYLGGGLLAKGLAAPDIVIGPFNQIFQTCLDYKATLGGDFGTIILLWRIEDLFPEALNNFMCGQPGAFEALERDVLKLADAVRQLRKSFSGTLIVSTPPYPSLPACDTTDLSQVSGAASLHAALLRTWLQAVAGIDRLKTLDLHGLILKYGMDAAHDARKWMLYHQPYAEKFWGLAGRQLTRILAAERLAPKKCLVLDLDNTLWGGIIGEDGLTGIELGDEFPGRAYRDFQRHALYLKSKGVMLAVASKNNPEDALDVFDRHDAMLLRRKDIVAFDIGWHSKVDGIQRIAKKLNIGLNALVFVDDSPKEIGEVQERLPDVACLLVPEEIADLPGLLAHTDLFDFSEITDEDRRRTEMMTAETSRQQLQETLSETDFKASLELKVDMYRAETQHLARITQLINKTNQFNLTTIRRTADEVEALTQDKNVLVLGTDIRDRYGEYGLVSVAVLKRRADGKACDIDTLLMSCRVLGRDAENAIFAKLGEAARYLGCTALIGKYIPTSKNDMVKDLYARFGFRHDAKTDEWEIAIDALPANPAHIASTLKLSG